MARFAHPLLAWRPIPACAKLCDPDRQSQVRREVIAHVPATTVHRAALRRAGRSSPRRFPGLPTPQPREYLVLQRDLVVHRSVRKTKPHFTSADEGAQQALGRLRESVRAVLRS